VGPVRRSFESSRAQAHASVADYQNVLLTLTADVAVNYFLARSLDLEITALRRAVELRNESAHILTERFLAGTIPEIASAQAKTELATAKAELVDVIRQRAEIVHALALLCGKAASVFELPEAPLAGLPVTVPVGLPSALLERRPDIARAERNLISKNAQIGSAKAAYFPALRLTGQAGYLSAEAGSLFATDSRVWSIGPAVSLPLFNAGRTTAEVRQAEASDREALADYRQTVLTAFKEVEDSLVQIVLRAEEAAAQKDALLAARRVSVLGKARYDAGVASYLEWIDAERGVLQHERAAAQLLGQRFVASVRLIKALGGGWDSAADRVKP
jgi:multidrug efflux system outer membrane protein